MASRQARVLIFCKTYPSPSGKHIETSCVAGMEEDGRFIRLFPIQFRLIEDQKQFKKWQWVNARIGKAPNDHRPESHKIFSDTIVCDGEPLSTRQRWQARREQLGKIPIFDNFASIDAARELRGVTLGLLRPSRVLGLDITPTSKPDWTKEEKEKLIQHERQGGLFDETDAKRISTLKKVPFDFHYRYACRVGDTLKSIGTRLRTGRWARSTGIVVRDMGMTGRRLSGTRSKRSLLTDLMFLMGTIHRFPDQWLIVSLIYPPKLPSGPLRQGFLFDP